MAQILLKNIRTLATVDENDTVLSNVSVRIRANVIAQVGANLVPEEGERVIDCSRHVVYPGFVNTHHHLYQTLQRCVPKVASAKLFDWLVGLYEIWRHLTPETVYVSAL
ncbi:MAG: 8-oxoguanine deaminase, partial [Deltaproteobacteria bacterium]|nr:8-oxoguanine deaminase [Deltaproteobacteria bacterium]